jgi:phosphoribosylformylglycinamidine synthase PurS subunit
MPDFVAEVTVRLRPVINDPQGLVVAASLRQLGFAEVGGVRVGKLIEVALSCESEEVARRQAGQMAERLLCNPVLEDCAIAVRQAAPDAGTR